MIYREIRPHFLLSEYVRCFWILEREYHGSESEVVWPDGNVELLFHFGDRYMDPMAYARFQDIDGNEFVLKG